MYTEILKKINKDINKNYVKIKFESNDNVPLNILVNIHTLVLVVRYQRVYINSALWATPSKLVNLLDFKPEKLNIETKSNSNNDIKVHHLRYENGSFYLTIDNIRGYFNFSNNLGTLTMLFSDNEQQNKYHQIWKEILEIINGGNGELKLHEKIKLIDIDLLIEPVFKISTITIAIRSLIEKNNKFYLELSLNHCLYEL